MKFIKGFLYLSILCIILAGRLVQADEPPSPAEMLGINRQKLSDDGFDFSAVLTHDWVLNASGGLERGTANLGNVNLTFSIDTEKAKLWDGGTFFFYYLGNYGNNATDLVGDVQVSSNIQAYSTWKLYQLWYNQSFLDDQGALMVGLYDYASEFHLLKYALSLRNSSFGITPEIAQSRPSFFPTTALSTRLRGNFEGGFYSQVVMSDGTPGDINDPSGTQIAIGDHGGVFWGLEIGNVSEEDAVDYHKIALGYWVNTTDYVDFHDTERDANRGYYLIGEQSLWHESDPDQGLGFFFQAGYAENDRNAFENYFGGGFQYTGLLPDRNGDVTAFGIASLRNSNEYASLNSLQQSETAVEFSHVFQILPYFTLQPDFQYVVNPGTNSEIPDAMVFTLRSSVAF